MNPIETRMKDIYKESNALRRKGLLLFLSRVKAQRRRRGETVLEKNTKNMSNHSRMVRHISSLLGEEYFNVCVNIDDFTQHTVFKITDLNGLIKGIYTLEQVVYEEFQQGYQVPVVDIDEEGEVIYSDVDPIVALIFNDSITKLNIAVRINEDGDIIQYGIFTNLVENDTIDFYASEINWDIGEKLIISYLVSGATGVKRFKKTKKYGKSRNGKSRNGKFRIK